MPIKLKAADLAASTKQVTPEGLDRTGATAEYFVILDLLDGTVNEAARKAASRTVQQGNGKPVQDFDNRVYWRELVRAQLRGWRLIVPPGAAFDAGAMYAEQGNYFWTFCPANVAQLTDDVLVWLAGEIVSCGGVIPTASLLVTTDSGQVLDFRRADAVVAPGEGGPVSDPGGDALVSEAGAGAGAA